MTVTIDETGTPAIRYDDVTRKFSYASGKPALLFSFVEVYSIKLNRDDWSAIVTEQEISKMIEEAQTTEKLQAAIKLLPLQPSCLTTAELIMADYSALYKKNKDAKKMYCFK